MPKDHFHHGLLAPGDHTHDQSTPNDEEQRNCCDFQTGQRGFHAAKVSGRQKVNSPQDDDDHQATSHCGTEGNQAIKI